MSPLSMSLIVFACVFGGALAGMALRGVLPEHHRSTESRDVVKLGMGLIATMSALLLGLLVASAKDYYELQKSELTQMTAKIVFLDRALALYGPETKEARQLLRDGTSHFVDRIWPQDNARSQGPRPPGSDILYTKIQELAPKNDIQRSLQAQAASTAIEIGQMLYLMFEQRGSSISPVLLVVVVFWLSCIFASFGLFAPSNATVTATLFVSALSVSCAIFLVLEMDRPFEGLLRISSAPLRDAITHLGQ
jgi:hypothetical protein